MIYHKFQAMSNDVDQGGCMCRGCSLHSTVLSSWNQSWGDYPVQTRACYRLLVHAHA